MSSSFVFGPRDFLPKPQFHAFEKMQARVVTEHAGTGKAPRLRAATQRVASHAADRGRSARRSDIAEFVDASSSAARFDAVVKQAGLTSENLARLFDRAKSAQSQRLAAKASVPEFERFGPPPTGSIDQPRTLLAYADPSPAASEALSGLLKAPSEEDLAASQDPNFDVEDGAAALPETPSDIPLPQPRPQNEPTREPAAETKQPDVRVTKEQPVPKTNEPRKAIEPETAEPRKLAYARPDDPTEKKSGGGFGQGLRNLFGGGARAGSGVAVYDISAARVYMPDGSVLEAHSGIGKMADNPRYVHVKMKGPTPPHTYNLKMREKRFHGVEAIRMLPVDGKNKHGRDGFLTHSYLLRGGRPESHGCVAFKDYNRFLKAFKQGKVRQLVVVPSGGRAAMLVASNGRASDG